MSKNSKKSLTATTISKAEAMFRCPICDGPMRMENQTSLICVNDHCFDVSKQGYVNLLSRAVAAKYDKRMFQARAIVSRSGFFEPLNASISDKIINALQTKSTGLKMIDAGCGEGTHLNSIRQKVIKCTSNEMMAVGVDISKEGIKCAAKQYRDTVWCVADIARCPFADHQFNVLLNILSPANYSEFQRMITDDGLVIKVIPNNDYLMELRSILYEKWHQQVYSNYKIAALFREHFELVDVDRVRYQFALDHTLIEHLLYMTPLSWGAAEERMTQALQTSLSEITVDLTILIGKKQ